MENSERKTIFLVDDTTTNLDIGKSFLKDQYKTYPLLSAEKMFAVLEKVHPDLILLDIEMPVMNGYEAIKKLKAEPAWAGIPVIFLTSKTDNGSEQEGLRLGAVDYVKKPLSAQVLLESIKKHVS
ncbi:MAG: response regulator [Spirochaetia bacterium]|jgi:putative two-component system response regulator|nr:response regulator [Spirochaetia bacterium]